MRRKLVAGNWKMNGSVHMVKELLQPLMAAAGDVDAAEMAVFPPFPYLARVQKTLQGSALSWGAQTLNPAPNGAYTGEVSASMLLDFGCRYVLVGHSERRSLFGEDNEAVADRFVAAIEAGLEPVLCVGETLAQREQGETHEIIGQQIDVVLEKSGIDSFSSATIAYEPVWAIGTGKTASPEQAQEIHAFIRDKLSGHDDIIGGQIRILYGGSVNPSNAADLFARKDIDGGLIGGASLKAEDFLAIYAAAN
ncbi:MAG TPA: triose-phosphate isomerase [Xanthomonadales bacterium]|nr:triose-phosphate isomerase [Xanthomonadales bacterium]